MPAWPILTVRVAPDDHARVERFVNAWRALHGGDRSTALRALIHLGLDAAARPETFDERWCDTRDRLARAETLLDALGTAVSALPALVTWLIQQAQPQHSSDDQTATAERLEALFQADWDERCRARGIPRPRYATGSRRAPIGQTVPQPASRGWRTSVRLPLEFRSRVAALALRDDLTAQAALRQALLIGLLQLESAAHRTEIERLLESTRRIEVQLDEIGGLATAGASVAIHLWCRIKGLPDEVELALLTEVHTVAAATWAQLLAGPPQAPLEDVDPNAIEAPAGAQSKEPS